jgi:hypothetical protein
MDKVKRKNGKLSLKLIVLLFILSSLQVSARSPYEFSIYGGGGYSFFLFRPYTEKVPIPRSDLSQSSVGKTSSSGASGDLGIGFTGFVNPQFGIHVGLGFSFYNVGVKVDSLKAYTEAIPNYKGSEYTWDLYSTLSDYREKHQTISLSIPVMLHFQSAQSQSWNRRADLARGLYGMAGIKLNILFKNTYESKVSTLYNIAHNLELDNWGDTQEFAGLGRFKGRSANGDFGYIQALLAVEAGMKWRVADNMYLYTGAFLEYGLNDPSKNNREPIGEYTDPDALEGLALLDFSSNTHLMTIGVKVRLAFIRYFNQLSCPQF